MPSNLYNPQALHWKFLKSTYICIIPDKIYEDDLEFHNSPYVQCSKEAQRLIKVSNPKQNPPLSAEVSNHLRFRTGNCEVAMEYTTWSEQNIQVTQSSHALSALLNSCWLAMTGSKFTKSLTQANQMADLDAGPLQSCHLLATFNVFSLPLSWKASKSPNYRYVHFPFLTRFCPKCPAQWLLHWKPL